ncbi:MAG: formylglycine-generating enzyme family protein [Phycisphaera sp.]|nr:formylglycine-generating enzyme family protein [Phycisphaera sp.]
MTPEPRLDLSRICIAALSATGCLLAGCAGGGDTSEEAMAAAVPPVESVVRIEGGPITIPIDGTSVEMEMVPVNGAPDGGFYAADTEVTWDLYDAFIFNLDTDAGKSTSESDAVTRPSKPYILVDRGYGHAGFAALSISPKAAEQLVEWLSAKTGRNFRIPTEAELSHLLATSGVEDAEARMEHGWFEENSDYTTHEVGSLPADANGLHDVWGNISEYAITPAGEYVVMGGSFIDPAGDVGGDLRIPFTTDWNADDPQIPKSPWWLASNDWVGLRVVCDP